MTTPPPAPDTAAPAPAHPPHTHRVVLVTGDRHWSTARPIYGALGLLLRERYKFDTLVHGGASGADRIAHRAARTLGYRRIAVYSADWRRFGRGAGPIRNQQMFDNEYFDLVLAFHDHIDASKGTKDCVERATRRNIPVAIIHSNATYDDIEQAIERQLMQALVHNIVS